MGEKITIGIPKFDIPPASDMWRAKTPEAEFLRDLLGVPAKSIMLASLQQHMQAGCIICLSLDDIKTEVALLRLTAILDGAGFFTPGVRFRIFETYENGTERECRGRIMAIKHGAYHIQYDHEEREQIIACEEFDRLFCGVWKGEVLGRKHFSTKDICERDGNHCRFCGKDLTAEQSVICHIVPKIQGGPTNWDNCVLSCVECCRQKSGRSLAEANMQVLPLKDEYFPEFTADLPNIVLPDNFLREPPLDEEDCDPPFFVEVRR